ncbi:signal peptidase I [Clostridium sardiniense]|uniref:signal peptidase I n=1 Tax=Clostridium sardiniense TaxID=29369 RepID=UPI00195A565C|nr:signal peptidase I [Clostridium sardiniense]MBM7833801.1 signal peptidase [Clostridium sardiniense]
MKKRKSSLAVIGNCIFYLFIIAVIFLAGINIIGSKEGKHPSILGYSSYYILTGSMEPTINPGSLVVVKDGTDQEINVGDVITFTGRNSNTITTHRVNQVINNGEEFITKGDSNNVVDPISVQKNQVIGKVMFHIPYLGKVSQFVQKNLVLILVVILALFGLSFLVGRKK